MSVSSYETAGAMTRRACCMSAAARWQSPVATAVSGGAPAGIVCTVRSVPSRHPSAGQNEVRIQLRRQVQVEHSRTIDAASVS